MKAPEPLSPKDKFDYTMKHFTMVADQRVKTFHFYVIVSAAAATVSLTVAWREDISRVALCLIGTAHVIIALVFWLIDVHGYRILGICAEALADLERSYIDGISERLVTEDRRKNRRGFLGFFSYRNCFAALFLTHAAFGALFAWHPDWLITKNRPNQTLEPTPLCVTPPAAREPRRP